MLIQSNCLSPPILSHLVFTCYHQHQRLIQLSHYLGVVLLCYTLVLTEEDPRATPSLIFVYTTHYALYVFHFDLQQNPKLPVDEQFYLRLLLTYQTS